MVNNEKRQKNRNSGMIKLLILAAVVLTIFLIFQLTPLSVADFTPESVKDFVLRFGMWAPIIFMSIYALRGVILVIPVGVMSLAGGLVWGKWLGTVYILIGATAGACLSFLVARYFGRSFIENSKLLKQDKIKSFDEGIEKNGFRFILFVRLIPLFQYDAVNFGSGLSKITLRDYALATFIGMIPGGFINALLGSSLDNIVSVQFFAALGGFVLLMLIPAIYTWLKKKKNARKQTSEADNIDNNEHQNLLMTDR